MEKSDGLRPTFAYHPRHGYNRVKIGQSIHGLKPKGVTMSDQEMPTGQSPPPAPGASEDRWERRQRSRNEKEEKDEKDRDHAEKDEKYTRDPLSALAWALIFIMAGLVLLVQSVGIIDWDRMGGAWNPILIGAGLILLLEAALRMAIPSYRRPIIGSLIFALIVLAMGVNGFFGWNITWPVFLILIGLAIILGGLFRGRY